MDERDRKNMNGGGRVLVVAGDPSVAADTIAGLRGEHRCASCSRGGEAYVRIRRSRFDVVLFDSGVPDIGGLDLLDMVRGLGDRPAVVLLSRGATSEWVRHAFKQGAYDVISVQPDLDELRTVVAGALAWRETEGRRVETPTVEPLAAAFGGDVGHALPAQPVFAASLERLRGVCRRRNGRASVLVLDVEYVESDGECDRGRRRESFLQSISLMPARASGAIEFVGRLERDRFAVALREADEDTAVDVAEQIRLIVRDDALCDMDGGRARLRIGVATSQPGFIETGEDLVERAAAASVRAKEQGGNQTVCWSQVSRLGPSRRQLERASVDEVSGWIIRTRQQAKRGYIESTLALVAAVEAKEPHTREHARVVSGYCEEIGRRMELPAVQIESLRTAALLHDIGKIGVPDAILRKPGPLTADEFAVIKRHPEMAIEILGHTSYLGTELPYILHHHERFDGRGYPDGLRGDEIPLGARILNVGDSLDAMLSTRCYKRGMSLERVAAELDRCAGAQFDPEVARVAREWLAKDRHLQPVH